MQTINPSALPAAEKESTVTVLILATGADKMTNGKPTGLWLEELAVPYEAFRKQGYRIVLATPKGGPIPVDPRSKPTPEQEKEWAGVIVAMKSSQALDQVVTGTLDAVFVPGGHGAMFDLGSDQAVGRLISELYAQKKVVASVCHGPAALVHAMGPDGRPLVNGKKVAVFTNEEEDSVKLTNDMPFLLETRFRELGAIVSKGPNFEPNSVRDGNLITGQNPPSSAGVAKLVIEALQEKRDTASQ